VKRRYTTRDHAGDINALLTVGRSVDEKLQWLNDFANRDLSTAEALDLATGELHTLTILRFVDSGGLGIDITGRMQPSDTPLVQSAVRTILEGLRPGSSLWFDEPPFEPSFTVGNGLIWSKQRGVTVSTRGSGFRAAMSAVVEVLVSAGSKLRRCEGCQQLYIVSRPHQRFCTTRCGGAIRLAKWRKENRDRLLEARHQQYARKVKAKLPGARVRRRPRG
jgi:hypothetical protein